MSGYYLVVEKSLACGTCIILEKAGLFQDINNLSKRGLVDSVVTFIFDQVAISEELPHFFNIGNGFPNFRLMPIKLFELTINSQIDIRESIRGTRFYNLRIDADTAVAKITNEYPPVPNVDTIIDFIHQSIQELENESSITNKNTSPPINQSSQFMKGRTINRRFK